MIFNNSASQLIRQRHSCRTYQKRPLNRTDLNSMTNFSLNWKSGPLGNPVRYLFPAASADDSQILRGLGTYGFIKDPPAFIVAAIRDRPGSLEDFGYLLELLILKAADLEIGSCWLGGTFTRSRFAQLMQLEADETIPAVVSVGYPHDHQAFMDRVSRVYAGSDRRLPWNQLFFDNFWDVPLTKENAGEYLEPLILLRLSPSASNKQPWRILRSDNQWHFYLRRTPNYPSPLFGFLLRLADLQRVDIGIAMAHFELGVKEAGQHGSWLVADPHLSKPDQKLEYIVSWIPDNEQESKTKNQRI
jgi:nitroreductase